MRRSKLVEVLGEVAEVPCESIEVHGDLVDRMAGRVRVGARLVSIAVHDHPEISLRGRQPHRVPVNQHVALTGQDPVGGMRLAVRDDPLAPAPRDVGGETVREREKLGHVVRMGGQLLPCLFGERPARPRLVEVGEPCLDVTTTGDFQTDLAFAASPQSVARWRTASIARTAARVAASS